MDLIVFWNHVGREHGGLAYAEGIRKNSPEVVAQAIALKEQRVRNSRSRFVRYNETTLLELPPAESHNNYIIVYCIDRGLQFSLQFTDCFHPRGMTQEQISRALKSFHSVITELKSKSFPNELLREIQQRYLSAASRWDLSAPFPR